MLWKLRIIKSNSEIDKINHICKITSDAYENLPLLIKEGDSERDISRKLRIDLNFKGSRLDIFSTNSFWGRRGFSDNL